MTLDELLAKVPPEFKPVAEEYGPAILAMTTTEIVAWINLLAKGRVDAAYQVILEKMPSTDLLDEWKKINDSWQTANIGEKARRALMQEAGAAILRVLLGLALAAVGL